MIREIFEERLAGVNPRDDAKTSALIAEYRKDLTEVQDTVLRYASAADPRASRALALIGQLEDTAAETLASTIDAQKPAPETGLLFEFFRAVAFAESAVTGRLKAALSDTRMIPQAPHMQEMEEAVSALSRLRRGLCLSAAHPAPGNAGPVPGRIPPLSLASGGRSDSRDRIVAANRLVHAVPGRYRRGGRIAVPRYSVKQGDCIMSIAEEYRPLWETIWNFPDNADLKELRKDPNILHPGDVVVIPEKTPRKESAPVDQLSQYVKKTPKAQVRLRLLDLKRQPRAGLDYTATVDGVSSSGTSDWDGYITIVTPPDARQLKLKVTEGAKIDEYTLPLGSIDPVEEVSGVQHRLTNLGYSCGSEQGTLGENTAEQHTCLSERDEPERHRRSRRRNSREAEAVARRIAAHELYRLFSAVFPFGAGLSRGGLTRPRPGGGGATIRRGTQSSGISPPRNPRSE